MHYTVYKHTTPSGKIYIGITALNPVKRWGGQGQGYCGQVFYRAIKKYGWDNILHEILFSGLSKRRAEQKEREMIEKYQSDNPQYGYNISEGGYATMAGRIVSVETRIKISKANTGKRAWNKGKRASEASKRKMSESHKGITPWNKGVPRTEEEKRKISYSRRGVSPWNKGRRLTEEESRRQSERQLTQHRGAPVLCVETNAIYYCSLEAERKTGVDHSSILKCCRGKKKTAGKKHWRFGV